MKKPILIAVAAVVVIIIAAGVWLYAGTFNPAKAKAFKKLSLPVAWVGSSPVTGRDFLSRVELADMLYKDDPAYNSIEAQGQILDALIDGAKLEAVAKQHGVVAAETEIDDQYQTVLAQFGGNEDQFKAALTQTYHLTPEQFREEILRPDVLQTNLILWYNGQKGVNQKAYDKLQELQTKLDQGQTFDEVVRLYTEDEATRDFGGDTGFVRLSDLASEFKGPLGNAKPGDRVTITSRYGLHIVNVVEIDKTGDEPSYHLQQIFVQTEGYDDWYDQQASGIKTHKFLKF